MGSMSQSPLDRLWQEYSRAFQDFDDHTLARWMAQTLGQLRGEVWRMSHPLVAAYRIAAQTGHDRQIWLKRLASPPSPYTETTCCRAPLLPLFTRDVMESGLHCAHCNGTAVPWEEIPESVLPQIRDWAEQYADVHAVAHWDDTQRRKHANYDEAYEDAALQVEKLLSAAARELVPALAEHYPAILWEDQDECLEVRPEDIQIES
jgi:hypothetical protein